MNKSSFLFMLSLFFCSILQAQFSGTIVYEFEYKTNSNQHIKNLLNQPKIDSVQYSIHQNHYKSVSFSEGEIIEEYVYDPASKKMLFSMGNRPYYLYLQTDLEKFKSSLELNVTKETEEILGYIAYKTRNKNTGEINYYADEIGIDAADFSTHYFMQWNQVLKQTNGGIPLKTITQHNGYTEIKTAIKIEEQNLNEMDFSIDKTKMQVAAYDNLDEVIDFPELEGSGFWCYQAIVENKSSQLIDGKDYQLTLRFVVHPDASITHVEVEESEYDYLNEAAKRIIKTCDLGFEAGTINGIKVGSEMYYPINF